MYRTLVLICGTQQALDGEMVAPEGVSYRVRADGNVRTVADGMTTPFFYAFRIDGTFSHLTARSVPAQEKPHPALVDAAKNQTVFSFNDFEGGVVGFRSPAATCSTLSSPEERP